MSCIFCEYFSSCGGMAEICQHFTLKKSRSNGNSIKVIVNSSMTISDAAKAMNMTVTDFLHYIGQLEREGKLRIKIR